MGASGRKINYVLVLLAGMAVGCLGPLCIG